MRKSLVFVAVVSVIAMNSAAFAQSRGASAEGPRDARAEAAHEGGAHEEAGEAGEEEEAAPRFRAGVDAVIGFGELADGRNAKAVSFLLGGTYHLTDAFAVGARWPFLVGAIEGKDEPTDVAVGNVEVSAEVAPKLARGVELPLEIGLALPTASGDAFSKDENASRRAELGEVAAASRGGENNALFAAQRLGIVPVLGLELERGSVEASIYTKLELLVKTGGAEPPAPIEQKALAAESVSGVSLHYWMLDEHFAIGARAWLSAAIAEEAEDPTAKEKPSRVQVVIEPGVRAKLDALRLGLSYVAPLGGELGARGFGGVRFVAGLAY